MNTKEHERRHRSRRSRSPRPSVFSRIKCGRSRSPRQNSREKEGGVFKRLGNRERSVSTCSDSHSQRSYSRYTKALSESEDSGGGHWKSRSKKEKSSREQDDLSQQWVCEETDPFTPRIRYFDFPTTRMPNHIKTYDGSEDSKDHLKIFQAAAKTEQWIQTRKKNVKGAPECMGISGFVHGITNPKLIKRLHDKIPKTMDEMMRVTTSFLRGEVAASNHERKKPFPPWRQQEGKLSYLIKELKQNNGKKQPKTAKKGETPRKEKPNLFPTSGEDQGIEGPMIIEAEIGGHCIHRMYVDGGSASEILYEHCFNRFLSKIKNQLVPAITSLIGFSGEAVLLTAHEILKIHVEGGIITLKSSMLVPLEYAMVSGPEGSLPVTKLMVEERIKVAINPEHPEQTVMIGSTLTEEGRNRLCNLLQLMVKKHDDSWRMCVDFKDLNKALPKDGYPLPDWKKKTRKKQLSLRAKEYFTTQICLLACGIPEPFHKQIVKNLKVYVDDLVIKSRMEDEIARDIEETFKTLREINMKLNPKKCTFGIEKGMFLGYKVSTRRLKVCPDKTAKAKETFKQMKQLIAELPMLVAPMEKKNYCLPGSNKRNEKMSRDVLVVGSTMRIPLLYRGEYSQWVKRFMNYLEEQTDGEAMINCIKNGDQPLPRVTQVSIAGTSSTEQPPLKDKSMWSDQEKKIQKIDHLARSLLIQGLPNDIYSLIDSNKTTKDLWDALARHMLSSEYGEQDRKAAVLYEYETFKATKGELFLDTYI
nr:reverse transcriptase domain-containing protein [Tanacetum cinerariifolium]